MLTFGDQNQLKGQTLTKYKFKIPLPRLDLSKISSSVACSLPSSATSVAFRLSKNQSTVNLHAPSADPQPSLLDHHLPYDIFTDRREGDSIKVSHVRNRSSPKLLTLVNQSHKSTVSIVQDTYNYSSSNHQQQIHPLKPKEPETGVSMLIEEEESFNNSEKNHTNRLQLFEERPQNQKNGQLIKKMQNMFTRQDGEPNLGGQPRPYLRNNQYSSLPGSSANHGELKAYFNEEAAKNTTRGAVAGNPKNQNEKEALALTLYPLVIRNPFSKVETPYVIDKTPVISVHSSIQTISNQEAPINKNNPSNNNVNNNSNNNASNNNVINNNNPSNNNVSNNNNNPSNNNYINSNNNNASNTNSNNTINNKHFFKFFRQSSRNANSQTVMNSPVFVPVNSMSYNSTTMPIANPCFVDANVSAKNIIFANNADNVNIAKAGEKKKIVELQAKLHPNGHRISKSHMTVVENKLLRIDVSKRQVPPLAELNLIDTNAANQQYKRAIQDHSLIDHQIQPTASQLARDAGPLTSRAGQNTMSKANNSFFTKANSNDNSFTKPKENLPLTFRRRIDVRKIVHLEADPNQNRVAQPNTLYGKLKDAILNVKNSCAPSNKIEFRE